MLTRDISFTVQTKPRFAAGPNCSPGERADAALNDIACERQELEEARTFLELRLRDLASKAELIYDIFPEKKP